MAVVFVAVMLAGFVGMVLASKRAVAAATALAAGSNLPPFFIGVTLLALGTDLPEIANSIVASVTDHGDVNVGDSVGSAATQATLVLGALPIIAGTLMVPKRGIIAAGAWTVAALAVLLALLSDGHLGRSDSLVLLTIWVVGSAIIYKRSAHHQQLTIVEETGLRLPLAMRAIGALAAVAGSAIITLWGIVGLAEELGAPEFIVSFFLASLGTSLPELVFGITAARRGAVALGIGDVVGSSFLDATLSVAAGPMIAPTVITIPDVRPAVIASLVAMAVVTLILARIREHDWRTGTIMIGIYLGFYAVLL